MSPTKITFTSKWLPVEGKGKSDHFRSGQPWVFANDHWLLCPFRRGGLGQIGWNMQRWGRGAACPRGPQAYCPGGIHHEIRDASPSLRFWQFYQTTKKMQNIMKWQNKETNKQTENINIWVFFRAVKQFTFVPGNRPISQALKAGFPVNNVK